MSPLFDSTGRQVDSRVVGFTPGLEVARAVVEHDRIVFFDRDGLVAVLISRPSYPGAGLSLSIADHVRTLDEDL